MADYLSVAQVAKRLNVCNQTVYRLTWRGKLRSVKVGSAVRIASDDLDRFLTGQAPPPAPPPAPGPKPKRSRPRNSLTFKFFPRRETPPSAS